MISSKTNYLQQTVEIGNPIPEAQLKPPHDVAGMTPQGPPRNTIPCLERQLEKDEKLRGIRWYLRSWFEQCLVLILFSMSVMSSPSNNALGFCAKSECTIRRKK